MKKILLFSGAFILALPLFAQLSLYGDYTASFTSCVRENGYDTPLNRDNAYGIRDMNLENELVLKAAGGDDRADLELWFDLGQYPIGAGLLAADAAATYALVAEAGDSIYTLDLMRASVGWSFGEAALVRLGRQSLLSGYGYGWNPMDFANPAKDPSDPKAELKGVDALSVQLFPYEPVNVKVYALYDRALAESGADYADLMGGAELTASLPSVEIKLSGFLERDGAEGEDARVSGAGGGFIADLTGLGVYGEGALLSGRRVFSPDLTRSGDPALSFLAGLEYVFPSETALVAEYFFNGEGYDKSERDAILTALNGGSTEMAALYRPGYYSRHYVLVNGTQPLYAANTDLSLAVLYSADTGALTLIPGIAWNGSGSFTLSGTYAGLFNLTGEESSENALAPVKHSFVLEGKFSF